MGKIVIPVEKRIMNYWQHHMTHSLVRAVRTVLACLAIGWLYAGFAAAQEQDQQVELQPLPAEIAAEFDQALTGIALENVDVQQLETRIGVSEGLTAQVLEIRRDRIWTSMFQNTLELAKDVADRRDDGLDVASYEDLVVARLSELAPNAIVAIQRMRSRVTFPIDESPPEEFVLEDQKLFRQVAEVDALFAALISYVEIADRFDLDASPASNYMTGSLTDHAANRSIFLELAIDEVATFRAATATLPDNTNLKDSLSAAETRVRMTAAAMQEIIELMNALDLDTRAYRQQVLTVTGEITADVLDVGIIASLVSQWSAMIFNLVASEGPRLLFRLLLVLLILFVFFQFSKLVQKGVERGLNSAKVQISHLLRRMIISTVRNLVFILGILIAISQLGISLGPLLAGLGIAGFIIGFALQDSLSNFASGILILLYRPFDVGDTVTAGGVSGRVSHMSLVNRTFMTFDNQKLVVPNNAIWQSVITNFTAQKTRRVDLTFGIAYDQDIDEVEKIIRDVLGGFDAILEDPEPMIKVNELADSSVNIIVRPWVNTDTYWDTYWDLTKAIKQRFDKEGINIPFPQRDVHVIEQNS